VHSNGLFKWVGLGWREGNASPTLSPFFSIFITDRCTQNSSNKRKMEKKKNNTVCQVMNEAVQQKCQEVAWQQLELPRSKSC
jgi:hypothetical protein